LILLNSLTKYNNFSLIIFIYFLYGNLHTISNNDSLEASFCHIVPTRTSRTMLTESNNTTTKASMSTSVKFTLRGCTDLCVTTATSKHRINSSISLQIPPSHSVLNPHPSPPHFLAITDLPFVLEALLK
jgi:hypothetical protein